MESTVVETSLGRVPIWIRGPEGGPLVVAIRGAFPLGRNDFEWLNAPGAQFAFLHLPGFYSPFLRTTSIAAFATAFEEAIARRFPGRAYVAAGLSAGSLVAMSMRKARGVLAVEPFLETGKLWALFEMLTPSVVGSGAPWVEAIFGRAGDGRDYRSILEGLKAPTEVIVGDVALFPRRPIMGLPSLCDEADRAALAAHPYIRLRQGVGGHAVHNESQAMIQAALARLLAMT